MLWPPAPTPPPTRPPTHRTPHPSPSQPTHCPPLTPHPAVPEQQPDGRGAAASGRRGPAAVLGHAGFWWVPPRLLPCASQLLPCQARTHALVCYRRGMRAQPVTRKLALRVACGYETASHASAPGCRRAAERHAHACPHACQAVVGHYSPQASPSPQPWPALSSSAAATSARLPGPWPCRRPARGRQPVDWRRAQRDKLAQRPV